MKGAADAEGNAWIRFTRELWRDLRDLVRIQNMERPDVPLLAPTQIVFSAREPQAAPARRAARAART